MKICRQCGAEKDKSEFYKFRSSCKSCVILQSKKWQQSNKERKNAAARIRYAKNPNASREARRRWDKNNKRRKVLHALAYQKRHPGKHVASVARRRASKYQATPKWANRFFIDEIYDLAQRRTRCTGIHWHVDHIVPLKSPTVCGLHVENNLQVIPAKQNYDKRNSFWPDMP